MQTTGLRQKGTIIFTPLNTYNTPNPMLYTAVIMFVILKVVFNVTLHIMLNQLITTFMIQPLPNSCKDSFILS